MMKTLKINGVEFTLKRYYTKWTERRALDYRTSKCYDILQAYKYPSNWKIGIWNEWEKWFKELNAQDKMKIPTWSHFYFTIGGIIMYEGKKYYVYITKGNNYIVEIK